MAATAMHLRLHICDLKFLLAVGKGTTAKITTARSQPVLCSEKTENQQPENQFPAASLLSYHSSNPRILSSTRREATLQMAFAASFHLAILLPAQAFDDFPEGFRVYSDSVNKYTIFVPQDWQVGSGEGNGIKSITAFYPEEASSSNVSVVITGLGPDFTRLESFGKVDAFAENLDSISLNIHYSIPVRVADISILCWVLQTTGGTTSSTQSLASIWRKNQESMVRKLRRLSSLLGWAYNRCWEIGSTPDRAHCRGETTMVEVWHLGCYLWEATSSSHPTPETKTKTIWELRTQWEKKLEPSWLEE